MGGHNRPTDALSMLDRSHRRLEERLEQLCGAAASFRSSGDSAALDVAREVCEFLQHAAARHERDEERSVFPRIASSAELIADLTEEHRLHEAEIASLAALLEDDPVSAPLLVDAATALEKLYAAHLAREERDLMPRIRDLDTTTLDAIYAEMQARRGR